MEKAGMNFFLGEKGKLLANINSLSFFKKTKKEKFSSHKIIYVENFFVQAANWKKKERERETKKKFSISKRETELSLYTFFFLEGLILVYN